MRKLTILALAVAFAAALTIPAAAQASTFDYSLTGTGTADPGGCLDCLGPTMDSTGTALCSVCAPGKPTSGTFSIQTKVTTTSPGSCKVKSVSGTLEVTWDNALVSTASVSGKFRDSKTLALAGAFFPTDPIWPADPTKILLNNFPPNPCLAAGNAITGTLAITMR